MGTQTQSGKEVDVAARANLAHGNGKKPPELISQSLTQVDRSADELASSDRMSPAEPQGFEALSAQQRHARVAEIAYYLSEARGFQPGYSEEDWRTAEAQVSGSSSL
jgi:hypothetical protein